MAAKSKVDWAGPVLWAAGCDVDDRHWRKLVESNETLTRRFALLAQGRLDRDREGRTLGESIASVSPLSGVLAKLDDRLSKPELARVVDVGADVLTGRFESLEDVASDEEPFTTEGATVAGFDFGASAEHAIDGRRLNFIDQLGPMLAEISKTNILDDAETPSDDEISAARHDVRHALKIGLCLYEASSWVMGPEAFGLRQAAWLARNAAPSAIMSFALGIARLRRRQVGLLSSEEIAQLAFRSELFWLFSTALRKRYAKEGQLSNFIDQNRLKMAFTDSIQMQELIKEIGTPEFFEIEIRPWDEWRNISKTKTMSPGLLAMSIGAPLSLRLGDIMAAASVNPAP
jgi:hypothetical protein